jgi:HPt (histidine-containing phosphotransfer) domain-containing protein
MESLQSTQKGNNPGTRAQEEVFDRRAAIERLGSETLLSKVVALFLSNAPNFLSEIRQAIADGDSHKLERSAHTFASSMAYLSARPASEAARALERMGHDGNLQNAGEAYASLEAEIERLKAALSP